MTDIIKDTRKQQPEINKPFYYITENRDGSKIYYKTDYTEYLRYVALYGIPVWKYSYTCNNADKVYN